jgi:hypothetical protein
MPNNLTNSRYTVQFPKFEHAVLAGAALGTLGPLLSYSWRPFRDYILGDALRRSNLPPLGDLDLRAAMKQTYSFVELPKPAEIERSAQPRHPYCSIASWYLWLSLENQGGM